MELMIMPYPFLTPIYKCLIIYNVKHGGFRRTAAEIRSEL